MKRSNAPESAAGARSFMNDRAIVRGWSQAQLWEATDAVHAAAPAETHVRVAFHPQPIMAAAIAEEIVRRQGVSLDD